MSRETSSNAVIFALATGPGRGAVAILRVSGAESAALLAEFCDGRLPLARKAVLRTLRHQGVVLDQALVLWFPGPNSYTGEDSFELHLHAGQAVIEAVSEALVTLGARPAEPGEFTRRAVQNGRLDLLQAEAIADLVEAETQAQRKQALRQADGALSRLYHDWAARLRAVLARQEALIDFPDEDLPPEITAWLEEEMTALSQEIEAHLQDERGEITRNGLSLVIAGSPNVGKSSLLNALSGQDAAIVTHKAGTTRDVISVDWMLDGIKLRLTDTAGLRETEDDIEAEGIRRAMFHVKHADLVLHLLSPGEALPIKKLAENTLLIRSKTDITPAEKGLIGINTITEEGLAPLLQVLRDYLKKLDAERPAPPLTRARHRAGLKETLHHLGQARNIIWPELRGEELRLAMQALGRLTGQISTEALLDTIFGQFCIGK